MLSLIKTTTISERWVVSKEGESIWALQAAVLSEALEPIIVRGYSSIYREPKGQPFAQVTGTSHEYGFDKYNALHQPELEKSWKTF